MANHAVTYTIHFNGNGTIVMNDLSKATERANAGINRINSNITKFANLGFVVRHISGAFRVAGGAINDCVKAYEAAATAGTQLTGAMRNNMNATAEQIRSIRELATAQQRIGVVDDDTTIAGAKQLSLYLRRTESLKQMLPVMNDLMVHERGLNVTQETAVTTAELLGKAFNGQYSMLARSGIIIDDATQKILENGTEQQKVAAMVDMLTRKYGGMNREMAATPEGKLKQARDNLGDMQETIGAVITKLRVGFAPTMNAIAAKVSGWMESIERRNLIPKITAGIENLMNVVAALAKPVAVVLGLTLAYHGAIKAIALVKGVATVATTAYTIAVKLLGLTSQVSGRGIDTLSRAVRIYSGGAITGSVASRVLAVAIKGIGTAIYGIPIIGWIAAIIAALIALFKLLWEKSRRFRQGLLAAWAVVKAVAHNIGVVIKNIWGVINDFFIKPFVRGVKIIVGGIKSAIEWLGGMFTRVGEAVTSIWTSIGEFFTGVWNRINNTFSGVTGWFSEHIVQPIKNAFKSVWDFIKRIFDAIAARLSKIFAPIIKLWRRIFSGDFEDVSEAAVQGAVAGGESFDSDQADKKNEETINLPQNSVPKASEMVSYAGGTTDEGTPTGGRSSGAGGARNITLNIGKLVENITLSVTNLKESKQAIKNAVAEALVTAVNDANLMAA